MDEWKDTPLKDAGQISRGNALVDYKLADDGKISFFRRQAYSQEMKFYGGATLGSGRMRTGAIPTTMRKVEYTRGTLRLRT